MKTETIYDAYGRFFVLPGLYSDFPKFFRLQHYNPNGSLGDSLIIREPEGWDKVDFTLKRDPDWHGVSQEYSNARVQFSGKSGRDFIETIYQAEGHDAIVTLQIGVRYGDTYIVEYEGCLSFGTRQVEKRKIAVALERKSLRDKLMARWASDFTISSTQKIPLLSQSLAEKFECNLKTGVTKVEQTFSGDCNGHVWIQFDTANPQTADIEEFASGKPAGISESSDPVADDNWLFKFRGGGTFNLDFTVNYRLWWTVKKRTISVGAARITRYAANTYITVISLNGQRQDISITEPLSSGNNGTTEVLLMPKGRITKQIDIKAGDKLFLYGRLTFSHNKNELQQTQIEVIPLTVRLTLSGSTTKNSATSAGAVTLYDALEAGVVASTDLFDRLRSSYYGLQGGRYPVSGPGAERLLFNGFAARNFKETEHPISTNLQDLMSSCQAIDGVGMAFGTEINDLGIPIDTVVIKPVSEFYQAVELLRLDEVIDYKEQEIPTELISSVEVGYDKYVEEGTSALEEVHTKHQLTTPVRNYEGKKSFVSKLVASTLAIERTRREQFTDKPKDGTEFDDSIFIVQCKPASTYSGPIKLYKDSFTGGSIIEVPKAIEWMTPGMTVFVFGSVSNNYPYEVTYISDVSRVPWTFYVKGGDVFVDEVVGNGQIKPSQLSPLMPETGADLGAVTGIAAADTAFNLRLTPGRMLFNTVAMWGGCLRYKEPNEEIYKSRTPQNKMLATAIAGENPTRVTERKSVYVDEVAPRLIYAPEKLLFQVRLKYQQVQRLRLGLTGMLPIQINDDGEPIDRNYGYVSLLDPAGIRVAGYVDSLKWKDTDEIATFELHRTALDLNDTSSGLDCAQFRGWTFEQAENADDRTRRRIELCTYVSVDVL
jgi:hypothetical protein